MEQNPTPEPADEPAAAQADGPRSDQGCPATQCPAEGDAATESVPLAARLAAAEAAIEGLRGIETQLWESSDAGLAAAVALVDELGSLTQAATFSITAEAVERGATSSTVFAGSRSARSVSEWLMAHAPSMRHGGSRRVADLITETKGQDASPLRDAIVAGEVPLVTAARITKEMGRLTHRLQPGAVKTVWQGYVDLAKTEPKSVGTLRPAMLARFGAPDEFQKDQDAAHRFVSLSSGIRDGALWLYEMRLDSESRAALESAIGPLSAPKPGADGHPDLRASDQRRGHALVEVCRRATAAATDIPTSPKTQLVITCDYQDLKTRIGAGTTTGGIEAGTLIAPETVRKLACDAQLIPAVLGTKGEALEWGRAKRLFTPAQIKALWERDGGCTFPGCSSPPGWCDAHHLRHWADNGETNLTNAALLCGFHHTTVHQRRLAGRVTHGHDGGGDGDRGAGPNTRGQGSSPPAVRWDLTRGSYDLMLAGVAPPEARAG